MSQENLITVNANNLIDISKKSLLDDDFQYNLNWSLTGTGADPSLSRVSTSPITKGHHQRLQTRTTLPATGDTATAHIYIPINPNHTINFLCDFRLPDISKIAYFRLFLDHYGNGYNVVAGVEWKESDKLWRAWNDTGAYATFAATAQDFLATSYNRMLLTVNPKTEKYETFSVNNRIHPISETIIQKQLSITADRTQLSIQIETNSDAAAILYTDQVKVFS